MASFYYQSQFTASGGLFDSEAATAAHRSLPLGSRVKVSNPATGRLIVVRITDRGPYVGGRCLDLARGAFRRIAPLAVGITPVVYRVLD